MKSNFEPIFQSDRQRVTLEIFNNSSSVFIYGTGTFAQDVFRALTKKGIYVSAFLDHRQPMPKDLHGTPVMHPEAARDAIILIGIHNREADILSIILRLEEYGAKRIISPVEMFDFLGSVLGVRYWLTNRRFYEFCKSSIEKSYSLLADDASRILYSSILEFRLTGNYKALPIPDFEHQYFPLDIPSWEIPLRLVDCGAFDGDTLSTFIDNGIKIDAVAAFEPDLINFAKLSQYVSTHKSEIHDATLFPCGVYHSTTQLTFEVNRGEANSISSKGKTIVQCISLDNVIPTFAPNLIKMDIEGAEYDALLGSRQIINTYLPGLAVSLYHRPEHLWQLPMLVDSMAPKKYNFYLRSHAMSTFDSVLYCVPVYVKKQLK